MVEWRRHRGPRFKRWGHWGKSSAKKPKTIGTRRWRAIGGGLGRKKPEKGGAANKFQVQEVKRGARGLFSRQEALRSSHKEEGIILGKGEKNIKRPPF